MPRRTRWIILIGAAIVVSGFTVRRLACRVKPTPKQALLMLIERAADAAEKRDIKTLRSLIAPRYSDDEGRHFDDMNRLLTFYFLRRGQISVYLLNKQVTVEETKDPVFAAGTVTALLTRGPKAQQAPAILPDSARKLTLNLTFHRSDEWKVSAVTWQGGGWDAAR